MMAGGTGIIGIDCATDPGKTGLAYAIHDGTSFCIKDVRLGTGKSHERLVEPIKRWIDKSSRVLLALDAPLGWPRALGRSLCEHSAGEFMCESSDLLFSRTTDRSVQQRFKKRPLEVGAAWIARTAVAALRLLREIGDASGRSIELAWDPTLRDGVWAIEVYPAATLAVHGLPTSGYKKRSDTAVREREKILLGLEGSLAMAGDRSLVLSNADALDAVVCVKAGVDFLDGVCPGPDDEEEAVREGWIWVRSEEK